MTDALLQHRRELVQRLPIYGLFDVLDAADLPPDVNASAAQECVQVVELVIAHDLDAPPAMACARTLLAGEHTDVVPRLVAWRETLAAAAPDRAGMSLALAHFGSWLTQVPAAEASLRSNLPKIAPVMGEMKLRGVTVLLSVTARSADAAALLDAAAAYGSTDGATVLAVVMLGARAQLRNDPTVLRRLTAAIPPDRTEDSPDHEGVIDAIAGFTEACEAVQGGRTAVDLALTLLEHNVSSAYATAVGGRKVVKKLPPALALAWLEDFALLAKTVGVRVVGFALVTLPRMYARHGEANTRGFVQQTAAVAEAYGTTAGEWFYEQKTRTAKEALKG